jgi:Reverse transcriptase (RNA-dependent DNA polymerase)
MKIKKWWLRSRIGIYLGKSPRHARSIALVLNPKTGNVSPQFHVKFNDTFKTIHGVVDDSLTEWKSKCGLKTVEQGSKNKSQIKLNKVEPGKDPSKTEVEIQANDTQHQLEHIDQPNDEVADLQASEGDNYGIAPDNNNDTEPIEVPTRRSARTWKPTTRYLESIVQEDLQLHAIPINCEALYFDGNDDIDGINPLAMLAKTDEDTMYWHQALQQPDSAQFIQAAKDEINTHEINKHWEVVSMDQIPKNMPILDSVWSMKQKRQLKTNKVYKHKARLNIHGGQQQHGVNYWETFAPVVTWAAIRLLLVLALLHSWFTLQIDFVLAYPQAPVECELFMQIPHGFTIAGGNRKTHALKILRNLYGQKQAG